MVHPLEDLVADVAGRARRLVWVWAAARSAAVLSGAALALGLVDYLARFRDPGVLFLCWFVLAGLAAWCVVRFLWPAWTFRPSPVYVAQRIEQRRPQLGGRLSSSIAFLIDGDAGPTGGSRQLRDKVIAETQAAAAAIPIADCLDPRRPRRAALAAAVLLAAIGALWAANPAAARIAARRLLTPWSPRPWPQRHHLTVAHYPQRLARGATFEVEVRDAGGQLPDAVRVAYWFEDGRPVLVRQMTRVGDKMVHRLENVSHSFRFRAFGGDDNGMPWIPVQVDDAPRVAWLQLLVHPPPYSGLPAGPAEPSAAVLAGSRIEVQGRATKQLRRAALMIQRGGRRMAARVLPDGFRFHAPADPADAWVVEQSTTYAFELADRSGLVGGPDTAWRLDVRPDSAPSVSLTAPPAHAFVSPRAAVRVEGEAADDLGLKRIELCWRRVGDPGPPRRVAIDDGAGQGAASSGQRRAFRWQWDLSRLEDLHEGDQIEYWAEATDAKPQTGRSRTQRLVLIGSVELDRRLAQAQTDLLEQLREALRRQQAAHERTRAIQQRAAAPSGLRRPDGDALFSVRLAQSETARLLAPPAGAAGRAAHVLDQLQANRLDRPELAARLEEVVDRLERLVERRLPEIELSLTRALKAARLRWDRGGAEADPLLKAERRELDSAAAGQRDVIAVLNELVEELARWDGLRRAAGEVGEVLERQAALLEQTRRLEPRLLARRLEELTAAERAELEELAGDQLELARGLERLLAELDALGAQLQGRGAAQRIAAALDAARRLGLRGAMRESGRRIERNQLGQAAQLQQKAAEALERLRGLLVRQPPEGEADAARRLVQWTAQLVRLRQRQQRTFGETADWEARRAGRGEDGWRRSDLADLADLARRQAQLAEDTLALARSLVDAPALTFLLERASGRMDDAAAAIEQARTDEAAQQPQRDALHQLETALAALQPLKSAAEGGEPPEGEQGGRSAQTASRSLSPLVELRVVRAMQGLVRERTAALERRAQEEPLSGEQQRELQDLAAEQQELATLVLQIRARLADRSAPPSSGPAAGDAP